MSHTRPRASPDELHEGLATPDWPAEPQRILIAEDELLVAKSLSNDLTELGYQVIGPAPNGQQAIETARREKVDLALLDVRMPVMDGLAAAEVFFKELKLSAFDPALGKLPEAVELFSILKNHPGVRGLFSEILGSAPRLADIVTRAPHVLDIVVDAGFTRTLDAADIEARADALGAPSDRKTPGHRMFERAQLPQKAGSRAADARGTGSVRPTTSPTRRPRAPTPPASAHTGPTRPPGVDPRAPLFPPLRAPPIGRPIPLTPNNPGPMTTCASTATTRPPRQGASPGPSAALARLDAVR